MNLSSTHSQINLSFNAARHKMIEQQIRPWNVSDLDVLNLLNTLKREHFVTEAQENLAFTDTQLPISTSDQVMLEPKLEARILQTIKPTGKEQVLEIGTGSGYMAALLAYFAKHVTTVEINSDLANFALENIQKSRIPNITVAVGDGAHGWNIDKNADFDIICISGGVPEVSKQLLSQLKIGGKLFAFVGQAPVMSAVLVTRVSHDYFQNKALFETLVPMLKLPKDELETFVF